MAQSVTRHASTLTGYGLRGSGYESHTAVQDEAHGFRAQALDRRIRPESLLRHGTRCHDAGTGTPRS